MRKRGQFICNGIFSDVNFAIHFVVQILIGKIGSAERYNIVFNEFLRLGIIKIEYDNSLAPISRGIFSKRPI